MGTALKLPSVRRKVTARAASPRPFMPSMVLPGEPSAFEDNMEVGVPEAPAQARAPAPMPKSGSALGAGRAGPEALGAERWAERKDSYKSNRDDRAFADSDIHDVIRCQRKSQRHPTFVTKAMETAQTTTSKETSRSWALQVTRSRWFTFSIAGMIAINAVVVGVETDYGGRDDEFSLAWYVVELAFTTVFCAELAVRLVAEQCGFFRDRWNLFDLTLVVMSCIDTFVLEFLEGDSHGTMDLVSVMRVLRIARVVRIIRLLRFFTTLWLLVIGVIDAMRVLIWAWVLIAIIIYVFSIFMTRTLGIPHREDSEIESHFGTVPRSMFTLFQVMTLEGWPTVARNAMRHEPWIWLVFIIFLLATTFSIMNVIVAVIVEGTLDQAGNQKRDLITKEEKEIESLAPKIAELFRLTDENGDGKVTKPEFLAALESEQIASFFKEAGVDVRQAENLFDILDYDESGSLDADEFMDGIIKARGEARAKDVLNVQCDLWRYESKVHTSLTSFRESLYSRMDQVDKEIDEVHAALQGLGRYLGGPEPVESPRRAGPAPRGCAGLETT